MSDVSERNQMSVELLKELGDLVKKSGGSMVAHISWPVDGMPGEYTVAKHAVGDLQNTPAPLLAAMAVDDDNFRSVLFEGVMMLIPAVVSGLYGSMPEAERYPLVAASTAFYATIPLEEARNLLMAEIQSFRDDLKGLGLLDENGRIDFNSAAKFVTDRIRQQVGVDENGEPLVDEDVLKEVEDILK